MLKAAILSIPSFHSVLVHLWILQHQDIPTLSQTAASKIGMPDLRPAADQIYSPPVRQ